MPKNQQQGECTRKTAAATRKTQQPILNLVNEQHRQCLRNTPHNTDDLALCLWRERKPLLREKL